MSPVEHRVERIRSADSAVFDEAWGALFDDCGARGEIERREVVERWLSQPDVVHSGGYELSYRLLAVRDTEGRLLAVRDHHVVVDRAHNVIVVYMAHALVLPPFRGKGVADVLRSLPRQDGLAVRDSSLPDADVLLAAEMEAWDATDEDTTRRLASYGRDGFGAIDPSRILYQQPDFRLLQDEDRPRPIPLFAVIERVGHPDPTLLPKRLAKACLLHLHAVFSTHCRARDLAPLVEISLAAIDAKADDPKVLPLPNGRLDRARFEPFERSRFLSLYPTEES